MKTSLIQASGALIFASICAGPAIAAERYQCGDAEAGISVVVSIAPEVGVGDFEGLGRSGLLSPDGQGAWVNPESGIRFVPEQLPPALFLGSEQFPCNDLAAGQPAGGMTTTPAEATTEQASTMSETSNAVETVVNLPGRSLGGNLRAGPGTDEPSLGAVVENAPLTIVTNSGVDFDGYDWFRVQLGDGRSGYQWGGILCSEGTQMAGLYQACGLAPTN